MPRQLTLIGTVHREPEGYQRLSRLLRRLQPHRLTLEMSPYALDYRLSRSGERLERLERILDRIAVTCDRPRSELAAHPAIREIRTLLALPFEYRAADDYCRSHGLELALVDTSKVSARKLERVDRKLITRRNLEILVSLKAQELPGPGVEGYRQAATMLAPKATRVLRQAFLAGRRGDEGIGPRDREMAGKIRQFWNHGDGDLVHVGGWVHLVEDEQGETLYTLLADLQPVRLLLDAGTTPSSSRA